MDKPSSKSFSGFFFANLFLSLTCSLLIFFLFIRLKSTENSFTSYFSKVLTNFESNFENSSYYESIATWIDPQLKKDEQEEFRKYKLSILAKTVNTFFKNLLVDTQNYVVTDNLKNFINYKKPQDLEELKVKIKQHLNNNPDLREVSTYDLTGNKIFGIKYKNSPNYTFNDKIVEDLTQSKNLLLKQGKDQNLILLSVIEDQTSQKPFIIISQSINKDFFHRILTHLEINHDVFYIKDSKNFVLFDNHGSSSTEKVAQGQKTPYKIYNALTLPQEENLKINLNNISYSLGTIVQKNNIWGNLVAVGFILITFLLSFLCIELALNFIKKTLRWKREENETSSLGDQPEPALQEVSFEVPERASHFNTSIAKTAEVSKAYHEVEPLTLEQYLLKENKNR